MAINASLLNSYNGYLNSHDKIDRAEALALITIASNLNAQSRNSSCGSSSYAGDKNLQSLINENRSFFDTESLDVLNQWLRTHRMPSATPTSPTRPNDPNATSGYGKVILDWTAKQLTWNCPWWPMHQVVPGGDPINNLYAADGPLDKYDRAFSRDGASRAYELKTHVSDIQWWGHCNNAAMVASTLKEPTKNVEKNGVIFTPHDIKGLLCKVIGSLVISEDMKGNRYDGPADDPYDPNPHFFLDDILKNWAKTGEPAIIMDVDNTEQVWNFPFDKIKVYESDKAPEGVAAQPIVAGGKIKYYRFECSSAGFPERNQTYRAWIQYGSDGKAMGRQWLSREDGDKNVNPDFAWRCKARGNLMDGANWKTLDGQQDNPYVLAEDVWQLYKDSI